MAVLNQALGHKAVPSHLVAGSEYGQGTVTWIVIVGGMGSGVALYLKSSLAHELFTLSRNWLTLGSTVSSQSARPRCQSFRIQKTKEKSDTLILCFKYTEIKLTSLPVLSFVLIMTLYSS